MESILNAVVFSIVVSKIQGDCVCNDNYKPVCGKNGVTYSNACQATCAGETIAYHGECQFRRAGGSTCSGPCPKIAMPVCGSDGKTHLNHCIAQCAGVEIVSEGQCVGVVAVDHVLDELPPTHSDCGCPKLLAPVCGNDGTSYGNSCEANCKGVIIEHEGECEEKQGNILQRSFRKNVCQCPTVYQPVCGADFETYSNECVAQCAGVNILHEGVCK